MVEKRKHLWPKQTISGTEASAPPVTVPQTVESFESQPDFKDALLAFQLAKSLNSNFPVM